MKFTAPVVAKIKEMVSLEDTVSALRAQIRELTKNSEKLRQEALEQVRTDPCYQALSKLYDHLDSDCKEIQELYIHWFLNRDENWDFSNYNAEREKELSPIVAAVESLKEIVGAKKSSIFERYYNTTELTTLKETCRTKSTELRNNYWLKWDKILKYEDLVAELKKLDPRDNIDVYFTPHLLTENSGTIDIELSMFIEDVIYVDDDEFMSEDDLKKDFEQHASVSDEQYNKILEILEKYHLKIVKESINEVDVDDIDGSTYYHKGYYEYDTGYGEPAGDFYYGKVTRSGSINYIITVE